MKVEDIYKESIHLSPTEKAQLVELILSSLSVQNKEEIDILWAAEVERRFDAVQSGQIKKIPMEEIYSSLR